MKRALLALVALISINIVSAQPRRAMATVGAYEWSVVDAKGEVEPRHEASFIEHKGLFYLLGGRGAHTVGIYDPATLTWSKGELSPTELNHFQAVSYGDDIYVVGAMNGAYPTELPLEYVWIYNPAKDAWRRGDVIPERFARGGAGTVLHGGKIYSVGGITYGHTSGTTNTFNSYDPATGEWEMLTPAPHIRDHFAAVVHEDKLYCIGGRNSSYHLKDNFSAFFSAVVPQIDVYDFLQERWYTLECELPVPTAAAGVVSMGKNIIYMGGEGTADSAYSDTQCYDTQTGKWSALKPMPQGLHGSSVLFHEGSLYWAAGSYKKGGSDTSTLLKFSLK